VADDFWVEGDYRLAYDSPCIDAGDPNSAYEDEPSPNGGRINIGAFGNTPNATESVGLIDLTGDYRVDQRDFARLAGAWHMDDPAVNIGPPGGDGWVDWLDLQVLTEHWMSGVPGTRGR